MGKLVLKIYRIKTLMRNKYYIYMKDYDYILLLTIFILILIMYFNIILIIYSGKSYMIENNITKLF